MPIDSLKIIKKMDTYLADFMGFNRNMASQLQATAPENDDYFTSHGYDHCERIIREIDNLFESNSEFYKDVKSEEIYCLCMAVLFHDLVMTKEPKLRMKHSNEAKSYIRQLFEDAKNSILVTTLKDSVIDAIADIVYAHSDIKNEDNEVIEKTLVAVKDKVHRGKDGKIRTNILSGLLRFGDELDCTSERITACQKLIRDDQVKNNPHWRKCELIREIKPSDFSGTDIVLSINDKLLENSDDKFNDIKRIKDVLSKLETSLLEINEVIFKPNRISWWHYNTIRLTPESDKLVKRIESTDVLGIPHSEDPPAINRDPTVPIPILNKDISGKLNAWIVQNDLLKSGHFVISEHKHARDWIDTSKLLENYEYLGNIVKNFLEILFSSELKPNNTFLVGNGFPGLIIASQLSFVGGYGATYLTREMSKTKYEDIITHLPKQNYIVIITDVVVEGDIIKRTIEQLGSKIENIDTKIKKILTVFYRKPIHINKPLEPYINDKLISLSNDFPIQLCGKKPSDCIFYKNKSVEIINDYINLPK